MHTKHEQCTLYRSEVSGSVKVCRLTNLKQYAQSFYSGAFDFSDIEKKHIVLKSGIFVSKVPYHLD